MVQAGALLRFALLILDIGSSFFPDWSGPCSSCFKLPIVAGVTGAHHCAQLFFLLFRWGLMNFITRSETLILPISIS
jgi:hypothetical protein